ncbi:MAG: ATP-NAD kinase family protein, partial [Gammaproteobacteria bacterium]|nr:ATP-NAD kinase family protein [Gammaproteobacteria bacterium]
MLAILKIGLIINPIAGIGGRVALKGSDTEDIQQQALALGAKPEAEQRTQQALELLLPFIDSVSFYSISGAMGGNLLESMNYKYKTLYCPENLGKTTEADTIKAAIEMKDLVDIVLFAGGDGTARNILQAVGDSQLCLGIPAGCKIYSGVFTVTPENAGELIVQLLRGELVEVQETPVLDINEAAYRVGDISTKVFGDMLTPRNGNFVQSVKVSGKESEELIHQDIAAWVVENMQIDTLYLIGSGSSCMAIKDELGINGTLLGVDVVLNDRCIKNDATEQQLLDLMAEYTECPVKLVITVIGGHGILLGRGNHQVCHKVIRQLGLDNLIVVASKSKIKALDGRALGVDTGDQELNRQLSGFISVTTGYDDSIIYSLGN